jgi:4-amino-4-deoxy-L-arabinose transferase-like glycosyltransferase
MIGGMRSLLRRQRPSDFPQSRLFVLLLFFVALLPRLLALGQYITPDELNWVHRSVLFHQALAQGRWADTLTTGHPGVITTWLGALGLQIQLWLRPSTTATYDWITHLAWLAPENTAAFPQLATFLSAGRTAVAVFNSLGIVIIFGLARRLVPVPVALAAGFAGLLALDPFVAGLSGLLHLDGLLTTFTTISLLALALALDNYKNPRSSAFIRVPFVLTAVSGVAAGCALLTKSAALTLWAFTALVLLVCLLARRSQWRQFITVGLLWLGTAVLVQFLLLPALWSQPTAVYQTILNTLFHESEEIRIPTFFLGITLTDHPGDSIFYPVALAFRLHPVVFAGLLVGLWQGVRRRWPVGWWQRPYRLIAVTWPLFLMVVLTVATRKYDRYLLPALPLLFLLGVMGWGVFLRQRPSWTRRVTVAGAIVVLLYLGTAVPYLLNAYNPLVGGPRLAVLVMPLGWGEAVSVAAQWLAEQPDAAEKTAVAGIAPAFAPFFPGTTLPRTEQNREAADYVVATLAGLQAVDFRIRPDSDLRLLHTIRYDGADQAWIYANDNPIEPDVAWQPQSSQFGDQIRLVAAGTAVRDDALDVYVQWQRVQPTDGRFNVQLRLLDENDQLWSQLEMPLLNEVYFYPEHWQPDEEPIWRYALDLPPGLPPARYHVELSLFAADSGAQLPVLEADGRFAGVVQPLTELDLAAQPLLTVEPLDLTTQPQPALDGDLLFLGQSDLPANVLTAGNFTVDLFWQAAAVLPANLQLHFRANEVPLATVPLSRFDSALWQAGQVIHEKYVLPVPAALAAGIYHLQVEVVEGDGRSRNAPAIQLGQLTVVSPDRLFTLPDDVGQPVVLRFGDWISLRGYELETVTAVPGTPVHLTLYWQVDRQPDEILSTFVHLVGPDGQIVVQGDQWPGGLPGNTWAEGQVIIDEYAIALPEDAPAGTYQIVLGLYPAASGVRLPIAAEDGAALPGDQFVLPQPLEVGR